MLKGEYACNIREKLFKIISTTAIVSNTIDFLSNYFLFGMDIPTIVCFCCAVSILIFTILGRKFKKFNIATILILALIDLYEFPYLLYAYGNSTIVYMVLGFIGTIGYADGKNRLKYAGFLIIYDVITVYYSFISNQNSWEKLNINSIMGATLCSLVIALIAMCAIILLYDDLNRSQEKKLLKLNRQLKFISKMDALTKVYNRGYLTEYLQNVVGEPRSSLGIALIDIDDFKIINDTYGHVFGDEVLSALCEIIMQEMNCTDNVFRYGGEEFFLIFQDLSKEEIDEKLKNISYRFKDFSMNSKNKAFSFSTGAAFYNQEDSVSKIYSKVDEKLYEAKSRGKNVVVWA